MTVATRSLVLSILGAALWAAAAEPAAPPLLSLDFESAAVGPYTDDLVTKDVPNLKWTHLYDRAAIVVSDPPSTNKALQITYPVGALGPKEGGGQFLVDLPPSEELWLSYRVKFTKGFDFKLGGKLPGLTSGGGTYTGGNVPKNGEGWSARYMWGRRNNILLYLYYMGMKGSYGENHELLGAKPVPNVWHRLTEHIKVNSDGKSDGLIEVWYDGKKYLTCDKLRLRGDGKGLIDSFYFSTFHGGNTRDWVPSVTSTALFDDFLISTTPPANLTTPPAGNQRATSARR